MILSIILSNNSENYELVHFFVVVVPTWMWYFMFMRMWTQENDLILLFLYLNTVFVEFQNNFNCQHYWKIEQDGLREQFEAVPIHILSDAFPAISIIDAKAP